MASEVAVTMFDAEAQSSEDEREEYDPHAQKYMPSLSGRMEELARPSASNLHPVRPVSARTWGKTNSMKPSTKKPAVTMFNNDLFGDANQPQQAGPNEPTSADGAAQSAARGLQHQKSLAAQKRAERLAAGGMATSNVNKRPGSAMLARGRSGQTSGSLRQQHADTGITSATGRGVDHNSTEPYHTTEGASQVERKLAATGVRTEFDPTANSWSLGTSEKEKAKEAAADKERDGAAAASAAPAPSPKVAKIDLTDIPAFLARPAPKGPPIQCYIQRHKGALSKSPTYKLFLDDNSKFLLSAKKRKKSKSSNYVISLSEEDLDRNSDSYFGKLRSNFVGTEFILYDNGSKPGVDSDIPVRKQLGFAQYQTNVMGTRGPRKMCIGVPYVDDETDEARVFRQTADAAGQESKSMLEAYRAGERLEDMIVMMNKTPRWNEQLGAYCLNFNGRVTHASVKNFQLVAQDHDDYIMLQFGKTGKDSFTVDYAWPLSALQAFGIVLTSFEGKIFG